MPDVGRQRVGLRGPPRVPGKVWNFFFVYFCSIADFFFQIDTVMCDHLRPRIFSFFGKVLKTFWKRIICVGYKKLSIILFENYILKNGILKYTYI